MHLPASDQAASVTTTRFRRWLAFGYEYHSLWGHVQEYASSAVEGNNLEPDQEGDQSRKLHWSTHLQERSAASRRR